MLSEFHIAVAVNPSSGLSIRNDLLLLKAALLYADKITLYSGKASIMLSLYSLLQLDPEAKVDTLGQMVSVLPNGQQEAQKIQEVVKKYKYLKNKKIRTRDEIIFVKRFPKKMQQIMKPIDEKISEIVEDAGTLELISAMESGMVEAEIYGNNINHLDNGQIDSEAMIDSLVIEYVNSVGRMIQEGRTYPLFDCSAGKLVSSAIREGIFKISNIGLEKSRHTSLVSNILQRLPNIEMASVSEIINIRQELDKPLIRFRAAMSRFAEEIRYQAWDVGFDYDAEKVFIKEVAPAVADIEEAVYSNKMIEKVLNQIRKAPIANATSMFGFMIGKAADFADISSCALGLGANASLAVYDGIKEWNKRNKEISSNQLYFYYKAGSRLN